MKYIMLTSELHGELPIIFPDKIEHIDVKKATEFQFVGMKVRSAGFVRVVLQEERIGVNCYGKSASLGIQTHHDDRKIIEICLRR